MPSGCYLIESFSKRMIFFNIQQIIHRAVESVGLTKKALVYTLSHSLSPYLHETEIDIRFIQELLEFKSSKTTEIYTWESMKNLQNI